MRKFIVHSLILCVVFIFHSCSSGSTNEGEAETKKEMDATVNAFLLKQPHELIVAEPKKLTGDYISIKSYNVPKDFPPQGYYLKFEGPTWENDLVGYRAYVDKRHRFDIFGKKVPHLVLDTVGLDYHIIHDWGADILKVGESFGIGSPAIAIEDKIYFFTDWDNKTVQVNNENDKSTITFSFKGLSIGETKVNVDQILTLRPGNPYTQSDVIVDGKIEGDYKIMTGIVKHPAISASHSMTVKDETILWTYGAQSYHDENLGMAVMSSSEYSPEIMEDEMSYILSMNPKVDKATYYFMADWANGNKGSKDEEAFVENLKNYSKEISE